MGIDLVMMATKGRSALGKAILGSVVGSIARSAPVPVFLVRPDASFESACMNHPIDPPALAGLIGLFLNKIPLALHDNFKINSG